MKKAIYRLESYLTSCSTESEKTVIKYILDNPREVSEMDIHTLAKNGFSSAATIVRICKKNGFKGYKDFKQAIINDLNFNDELVRSNFRNEPRGDTHSIAKFVLNENIRAINNTYNLMDFTDVDRIVELINKAKNIRIFGIGASFLVAKDLQQKLERVNKRTTLYEDTHLQLISSTNISDDEIAIVISYSGITKEIIDMAENIKKNNGIIITLTKYNNNKLMTLADYNLFVPNIESSLRISASSSRISQLCVLDILFHTYIEKYKEKSMEKIISTNKLLEKIDNFKM